MLDHAKCAEQIVSGPCPILDSAFTSAGTPIPVVKFNPTIEDLPEERLKTLLQYWDRLCDTDDIPFAKQFDPLEIRDALRITMLLEVLDGGADFRYLVYGEEIEQHAGGTQRGRLLSEHNAPDHVRLLFLAGYLAVMNARTPIFTEHSAPPHISTTSWRRIILPMKAVDGAVSRILVGNAPGQWRMPIT